MEVEQIFRDIVYSDSGQKLDLYLPAYVTGQVPLIVYIHGGAFKGGDKDRAAQPYPQGLAGRKTLVQVIPPGYVFASINYRLSGEATFPAQIHDCKAAIRWLRAHADEYHIDPARIGVWGASAGGHLAALLGTSGGNKELEGTGGNPQFSSSVQAVCDHFGPTNLVRMSEMLGQIDIENNESLYIGGPLKKNLEKANLANPITHIKEKTPPFLIIHGDSDVLVPSDQSRILYEALVKAKVTASLHIIPGAGHGFAGATRQQIDEIDRLTVDFFNKYLK